MVLSSLSRAMTSMAIFIEFIIDELHPLLSFAVICNRSEIRSTTKIYLISKWAPPDT